MQSRIKDLLEESKALERKLINFQIPLTIEEKQELMAAHAQIYNVIKDVMPVAKCCASCEHYVQYNGLPCCAARDMTPIPFDIENKTGGCSKWYEKDYIPF